jgi:hypothetical protein
LFLYWVSDGGAGDQCRNFSGVEGGKKLGDPQPRRH